MTGNKFNIRTTTISGGLRPNLAETIVSVLTITNLTILDSGSYNCRAVNPINSVLLPAPYSLTVVPPDYCSPNPCLNGGRCTSGPTGFQCECQGQFNGTICDMGTQVKIIKLFNNWVFKWQ